MDTGKDDAVIDWLCVKKRLPISEQQISYSDSEAKPHKHEDVAQESLLATMMFALDIGDMEWYWDLAQRVRGN